MSTDTRSLPELTRRRFLRSASLAGGGLAAAVAAACAPSSRPGWTFAPPSPAAAASASATASATPGHGTHDPGATAAPGSVATPSATPMADHDAAAEAVVKRFPEPTAKVGNQALDARLEGGVKVFDLECSEFDWQIDALKPPVRAVGYNGMWPGPTLRAVEGDRVRAIVRNSLHESTGVHFHGQDVPNAMDGVPFITQPAIRPGETFTYEFIATPAGSHMYHSHHNATDQVGRGLLGAFLVDPADAAQRYDRKYGVSQDVVWISNDSLGGFTINGKGFPATQPIVAKLGDRIAIRFMNEGVMMHPWHLHGMPMRVVARDGYPLGGAEFTCDTLGVNPGERWDVIVDCKSKGVWAFHCHILTHAEGAQGMFGMVNALIVE